MLKLNWMLYFLCLFFRFSFFFCCFSIKRMFYRVQMFFNLIKRVLLKCLFESFHFDACTASNKPLFSLFRYYFLSRGFNSDSNFFNVLQVFLMRVTDKEGRDWERDVTNHWIQAGETEKWNNCIKGNRINDDNLKWQLNAKEKDLHYKKHTKLMK